MSRLIPRCPGHETVPAVMSSLLDDLLTVCSCSAGRVKPQPVIKAFERELTNTKKVPSKGLRRCACVCDLCMCVSDPNSSPSSYRLPVRKLKGNKLKPRKRYAPILLGCPWFCRKVVIPISAFCDWVINYDCLKFPMTTQLCC